MANIGFKGGEKLEAVLRDTAHKLGEGKVLRVGFLEGATYPDGTPVAQVAFWNEYGTEARIGPEGTDSVEQVPPRPFFRGMIADKSPGWGNAVAKNLIATDYDADKTLQLVGSGINDQLTSAIAGFTTPGNAASTIAKKGFDKPLTDTNVMKTTHGFEIVEGT